MKGKNTMQGKKQLAKSRLKATLIKKHKLERAESISLLEFWLNYYLG